ncbi:hypothetical protein NDU88_005047 [Pleurodeles waltl]|uniref:Uncharacterized protein n=1 Tax=Pleurodeles waltl TaxID=8319 RepID=A0AAV7MZB4_PLEWA|nr:hypothetical protein NDU88_005047 [Pleurodeles waltl]
MGNSSRGRSRSHAEAPEQKRAGWGPQTKKGRGTGSGLPASALPPFPALPQVGHRAETERGGQGRKYGPIGSEVFFKYPQYALKAEVGFKRGCPSQNTYLYPWRLGRNSRRIAGAAEDFPEGQQETVRIDRATRHRPSNLAALRHSRRSPAPFQDNSREHAEDGPTCTCISGSSRRAVDPQEPEGFISDFSGTGKGGLRSVTPGRSGTRAYLFLNPALPHTCHPPLMWTRAAESSMRRGKRGEVPPPPGLQNGDRHSQQNLAIVSNDTGLSKRRAAHQSSPRGPQKTLEGGRECAKATPPLQTQRSNCPAQ